MNNLIKKYKKELIIFLSAFALYFILGLIFSYYLNTYNYWNVAFDMDNPRVFGDLTSRGYNHYRTSVHPLFVILFQPIVFFINLIIKNKIIVVLILQSLVAAMSLVLFFNILKKIGIKDKLNTVLTLLFGLSLGQIVFASNVETYIFAQLFLILLWLFTAYKIDKKLKYWDYIILILLGIGSLAVTITNFVQFIIAIFFLIFLNPKEEHKFFNSIFVIGISVTLAIVLADLQGIVWPSAPNFFTKGLTDILYGTSEEKKYIDLGLSFDKFLNVINSNFGFQFNLSNLKMMGTGLYLYFVKSMIINVISIIMSIAFLLINVKFIYDTRKDILKHKFYYAMLFVYLANFILHLFYGNTIAFLYICHYNFAIIIMLAYILNYYKKNDITSDKIFYLLVGLISLLSLKSIITMFIALQPVFNSIEYFSKVPVVLLALVFALLFLIIFKKKITKIISIILMIIILLAGWKTINYKEPQCYNCDEYQIYEKKFETYEKQLKDMKNSFSVRAYSEVDEPIGIFYFGMADRTKILYKNGKLINIKTKEIIKEFEYTDELIVPNEYTVVLKNNNTIYKIVENEKGIYLYTDGKEEVIVNGNKPINLPEFDDYKYSEILKVLHQEILFNIDGDTPKPNIFGYSSAWYRDSMLATMVLEETNNTSLFENWVRSINKIYDNSRDKNINEADNLGELLYIIGAVGVDRPDLINDILIEIDRLKDEDKTIGGMVDGIFQKYYPSVLAIYGAEKNNIKLDLNIPKKDDGYAKLTWYYPPIESHMEQVSSFYPYINWAFYHYANYGLLYVLDEIYPLSYEGGNTEEPGKVENECFVSEYYCNKNLYISHMWTASEIFLMLLEY